MPPPSSRPPSPRPTAASSARAGWTARAPSRPSPRSSPPPTSSHRTRPMTRSSTFSPSSLLTVRSCSCWTATSPPLPFSAAMTTSASPSPSPRPSEVHVLAAFVHGALTALHLLGLVYNLRRRHPVQTALHVGGVVFSAHAVRHHLKAGQ